MAKGKKYTRPVVPSKPMTASVLTADPNLGYKLRVLLYDFHNVSTNPASQHRISTTTDPLYISSPYFTPEEASHVKETVVDFEIQDVTPEYLEEETTTNNQITNPETPQTIEDAIHARLSSFFDKRKASGDSRPCGPHDMAPIYQAVLGIPRHDLEEEGFLRRLRKSGLGTGAGEKTSGASVAKRKNKKKAKQ